MEDTLKDIEKQDSEQRKRDGNDVISRVFSIMRVEMEA